MPADAGIHAGSSGRSRPHPLRARASAAPTRGQPEVLGEAHLPRTRLTYRSSSGCRTGCGGCSLPPSLSWTGLGAPRRRLRGAQCSLTRGWGAGGGLYHSPPGGDPPSVSANGEGARAAGTRTRGGVPSPARLSRGGAAAATGLLIYLFPMCAPRCHGNRSIFSGVGRAPLVLNLAATEMDKRLRFLLAWGILDTLFLFRSLLQRCLRLTRAEMVFHPQGRGMPTPL